MRESLANIVIVVDDYGVTSGMVTLEDMLEEIVGQIKDEYDADEEDDVEKISDKEYIIDGSMNIDDFNERFGMNIESEDYESIGGIIMGEMERVPKEGDKASRDGIELKVEKMDKIRVDRVRVILP